MQKRSVWKTGWTKFTYHDDETSQLLAPILGSILGALQREGEGEREIENERAHNNCGLKRAAQTFEVTVRAAGQPGSRAAGS